MGSVQNRSDISNIPFIRLGTPALLIDDAVLLQDEEREEVLAAKTLMAYDPTNEGWVPFTDEEATDGTQYPKGILTTDITAAALAAGDVSDVAIWVGDFICDGDQIIIENSLTLDTIVNVPAGYNTSVKDLLKFIGIFTEATVDVDGFENE